MFIGANILNAITFFPKLDALYEKIIGQRCGAADGHCLIAYQTFGDLCVPTIGDDIEKLFAEIPELAVTVKENCDTLPFYHQGFVMFLIYLLKRHRNRLIRDWPLDRELLNRVASNIGVSLDN